MKIEDIIAQLPGQTWEARLEHVVKERAATELAIERLVEAREPVLVDIISDDANAATRLHEIDRELAELKGRRNKYADAISAIRGKIERDAERARRQAAEEKPRRVLAAVAKLLQAVKQTERGAADLHDGIEEAKAARLELAAAHGTRDAARVFTSEAGFSEHLLIALSRPLAMFGVKNPAVGARSRLSLLELEMEHIINLIRLFPTLEDATRAQAILAAREERTALVPRPEIGRAHV